MTVSCWLAILAAAIVAAPAVDAHEVPELVAFEEFIELFAKAQAYDSAGPAERERRRAAFEAMSSSSRRTTPPQTEGSTRSAPA